MFTFRESARAYPKLKVKGEKRPYEPKMDFIEIMSLANKYPITLQVGYENTKKELIFDYDYQKREVVKVLEELLSPKRLLAFDEFRDRISQGNSDCLMLIDQLEFVVPNEEARCMIYRWLDKLDIRGEDLSKIWNKQLDRAYRNLFDFLSEFINGVMSREDVVEYYLDGKEGSLRGDKK